MLSRLSGIANTVLQKLSGDGTDGSLVGPPNPELKQEPDMAFNNETNEDILKQLAYTEQLVEQLNDIIREKATQLQQKDVILEEERKAADAKMTRMRLRAKARLRSLNKRMEEKKGSSQGPQSKKPQLHDECAAPPKGGQMEGFEMLKEKLQEKEELISSLQTQLSQVQEEKAAQGDAPPAGGQMEGFEMLKEKLQEKEELISSLQTQLSQVQEEKAAQLKELSNLQQQYLQINQENIELRPLKAQLQESQEQINNFQEQLKQGNLSCQQELQHLRVEKNNWEVQEKCIREQYLIALSEKEQQLSHLQSLVQELRSTSCRPSILSEEYQRQASSETAASPESSQALDPEIRHLRAQLNDSLKEVHQKELRIQMLNSKLSQIFEEKSFLYIQLRGSCHSLRENHQRYSDLLNRSTALKKQIQERQLLSKETGTLTRDAAPRAPQEKNGPQTNSDTKELKEPQLRFSEAEQEQGSTKQEVSHLRKLLEEERDHRQAAEEALSAAREEIRRLELNEWSPARNSGISDCGLHEEAILIEPMNNTFQRAGWTSSGVGWRRSLRSFCYSQTRVPLLAALYVLVLHIMVLFCLTGRL